MSSASNIHSVDLNQDGSVTIIGTFTDMAGRRVALLHIWLAQPGADGQEGVGLASDVLDKNTLRPDGTPAFNSTANAFELTALGAEGAKFSPGPATVSAIAVIAPAPGSSGLFPEVIQWSRTLTLSAGKEAKHVGLKTLFGDG